MSRVLVTGGCGRGLRVAHVVPDLSVRSGGPTVTIVEASRAVAREGVESTIFATDLSGPAWTRRLDRATRADLPALAGELDVRLFPARFPKRLAFSPALARAMRSDIRRYDVVHIHSLFLFPQFAAFRSALERGVPYVVSPRGALDPWLRRRGRLRKTLTDALWQREMLGRAAALHFTSVEEARLAAEIAPSVPRAVVPNGISWDDFQQLPGPEQFRRQWLAGHSGPVVLVHGRLSAKKGLDVLIRALALVARRVPDCRLVLAGPDDEGIGTSLASLARELGVAERITFTGVLVGIERLQALAAADVWALPSHTENFGVAVVEARAEIPRSPPTCRRRRHRRDTTPREMVMAGIVLRPRQTLRPPRSAPRSRRALVRSRHAHSSRRS